ncbi:MAG: hypothetical protein ACOCRO_06580 [Halanaerobiales bacterium]
MDWESEVGQVRMDNLIKSLNKNTKILSSFYTECITRGMSEETARKLTSQLWERMLWGGQ